MANALSLSLSFVKPARLAWFLLSPWLYSERERRDEATIEARGTQQSKTCIARRRLMFAVWPAAANRSFCISHLKKMAGARGVKSHCARLTKVRLEASIARLRVTLTRALRASRAPRAATRGA